MAIILVNCYKFIECERLKWEKQLVVNAKYSRTVGKWEKQFPSLRSVIRNHRHNWHIHKAEFPLNSHMAVFCYEIQFIYEYLQSFCRLKLNSLFTEELRFLICSGMKQSKTSGAPISLSTCIKLENRFSFTMRRPNSIHWESARISV